MYEGKKLTRYAQTIKAESNIEPLVKTSSHYTYLGLADVHFPLFFPDPAPVPVDLTGPSVERRLVE